MKCVANLTAAQYVLQRHARRKNPMGQPARILIVESDLLLGAVVEEWLVLGGHLATHVRDVMSSAGGPRPDLIPARIPAPPHVARKVISMLGCHFPRIPDIAMTTGVVVSKEPVALDLLALDLGAAAVLLQPFTRDALLGALRRVCGKRGAS